MGCYYHYCLCQEARPSLTDVEIERRVKKRQQDEMRGITYSKKDSKLLRRGSGGVSKTDESVKSHLRADFPYKCPSSEEGPMQGIIDGTHTLCIRAMWHWTSWTSAWLLSKLSLGIQKRVYSVRKILVHWWRNMQKKKILWFSAEECL